MGKIEWLGILCLVGGFLAGLFQGISSMMTVGTIVWKGNTLVSVFGAHSFGWINGIGIGLLEDFATLLVNTELALLLIGLGIIFFVSGVIFKRI